MGTMPKVTNTEPWQLMQAFANAGYGSRGGRYLNGNRSMGGRSYPAPQATSSTPQYDQQQYADALQDYQQNKEIYPEIDQGPPPQPIAIGATPTATGPISDMIRRSAIARNIDPATALKVAASEGGLDGKFRVGDGGSSFGPFQLHRGGMASGGNAVGGLGDEFVRRYGEPTQANLQQQIDFALDNAKKGGWGPWHGYHGGQWDGIRSGTAPVAIASNPPTPAAPSGQPDPSMTPDGRVADATIQRGKDQLQDQIQDMDMSQDDQQDKELLQNPNAFVKRTASLEDNPDADQVDPSSRLSWLV